MKDPGNPGGDRLELLNTFVRIVEAGNLSAAAEQLGTTQPTVSRRLQALERSLGLRLLQRSTHVMKLTIDGERCYAQGKVLLENWQTMRAQLQGSKEEPEGHLRVLAPHAFGQEQLIFPLADYLRQYPRVRIEWILNDRRPDFIAEGIDCAIQVGAVGDPSVVALRLAEVPRIVVAAPSLLAGDLPQHPQELARMPWLSLRPYYRDEVSLIHSQDDITSTFSIEPRLVTDSLYALRNAAIQGVGIGLVSAWLMGAALHEGRLVHLVPQWHGAPLPVYITYPYARYYPARLRLFLEVMKTALPKMLAAGHSPGGKG